MLEDNKPEKDSVPFYPDHVIAELKVAVGLVVILIIIGVLGMINPLGLGDPADPLNTPPHAKPEWYFLALYQMLKYVPKVVGVVAPVIGVLIIAIWPFLDRKPDTSPRIRLIRFIISIVGVIVFIAATIWGEVS